jgi:hypothetical protein
MKSGASAPSLEERDNETRRATMHPDFRQDMIRGREHELGAAMRDLHTREEPRKEREEPLAVRLIWSGSERSQWPSVFAGWMIAGR